MRVGLLRLFSVVVPKVLGGAGTVGLNLILMRRMNAADLGIFAMLLACVLLIDAIAGSAIDLATVKLGSSPDPSGLLGPNQIQKHAFLAKALSGLAAASCVFLAKPFLWSLITKEPRGGDLLYLACACATGLLLVRSVQVQMQLERDFVSYGLLDSAHLLLRFGLIFVCFSRNWVTPQSLLICYCVAPFAVLLFWAASKGRRFFAGRLIYPEVFGLLARNVNWLLLTFSLSAVISRMDLFLVSRWSSLHEAGIFAGGQGIAMVPQLLGLYTSVVFGPNIMPKLAEGRFFVYYRRIQTVLVLSALAGLGLFVLIWPLVSSILLPLKFVRSSAVILALMPGSLAGFVTFPLTLSFLMFVRPRFLFLMDCVALPFLLLAYYYAIQAFGAVGAAWTTTAAAVARAAIAQVMAWRWARSNAGQGQPASALPSFAEV